MVNLVAAAPGSYDVVETFPRRVKEITHLWIPLRDGTRLAARMWLPEDAEANPVPAIIEYIPYRQGDFTAPRDMVLHPYFAGHGYAAIRIDIRGSGNSEGLPLDEYVEREQDDALDALAWIATQRWCDGNTGMIGISWGGFAALQVAARRPPSLRAIITVCSTDDRYADDVHYMGGCLLSNNTTWGGCMHAYMARPPDPEVVGAKWRDMWRARAESAPVLVADWLAHPFRDDYWKHGSVCEDYAQVECAVYAVGGWTDGYSNAIPRLLAGLKGPRRGLIGPWAHGYPHIALPGPNIGFLQDALRWWNRWLRHEPNGIDEEPMLRAWMQDARPPSPSYQSIGGHWIAESTWPPRGLVGRRYWLNPGRLESSAAEPVELDVSSPLTTGLWAGEWTPHGIGPELALDQREDDGGSLVFDSAPLEEGIEILGAPVVALRIAADQPDGLVGVRLCSVAPDGQATRVSYGLLNLTHRDGHEEPEALEPGAWYTVRVRLNDVAQTFPTGSRLRIGVSTSHWPLAWPSPRRITLRIRAGESTLELPTRSRSRLDRDLPSFEKAAIPKPGPITWIRPVSRERLITRDVGRGRTTLTYHKDDGAYRLDTSGIEVDAHGTERHAISDDDPLSAVSEVCWRIEHRRPQWRAAIDCRTTVSATASEFTVHASIDAYEGDDKLFSVSRERKVPRRRL